MAKKRHKPEEIVAKLRQVDVLTSQGTPMSDAIRSIGVTEVTYYRWRSEYGGLKSDQVKRLKDLETENARLRKAISDLRWITDPAGGGPGKLLSPARRRACVEHVRRKLRVSERRACAALGQHRSTQRRMPQGRDDEERLTADIIELARQYGRYGYRSRSFAASRRLAGQRQAGGADLAARGPEGPQEAAQTRSPVVDGRLVRPLAYRSVPKMPESLIIRPNASRDPAENKDGAQPPQ